MLYDLDLKPFCVNIYVFLFSLPISSTTINTCATFPVSKQFHLWEKSVRFLFVFYFSPRFASHKTALN